MEKYEVVKDIGSGNFGVARLMRHKDTKQLVAMKFIERGHKVLYYTILLSLSIFILFISSLSTFITHFLDYITRALSFLTFVYSFLLILLNILLLVF